MTWLDALVDDLDRHIVELQQHAHLNQQYELWARHFEQDRKSIVLLAQAYKGGEG